MRLLSNIFDFSINHKDVTLVIDKNVTRNDIPYLILPIKESSIVPTFHKSQGYHIGVYHYLCGRMGIGYSRLYDYRLNGTPFKTCESMKRIGCVGENDIVHQNFSEQANNAPTTIKEIINFVDDFLCNVGVVFMTAWTWNAQVGNLHHGNPKATGFCHRLSSALLNIEKAYILLAISRLSFMYCTKSLEFIGDCCDAIIFCILRSVTSLWNWLKKIMGHRYLIMDYMPVTTLIL